MSRPLPGREQDFVDWYVGTHLPQIAALDGVQSAQRYEVVENRSAGTDFTFTAMYDIETDDINAVLDAMSAGMQDGSIAMTDAADTSQYLSMVLSESGAPISGG